MSAQPASTELLADYFVSYLFDEYQGTRHVRRIASWVGFIVKGIERLPGVTLQRSRSRQIRFDYKARQFKVRYNHGIGGRGGVQFVEVLPGRGAPEGKIALNIVNLSEAEDVHASLKRRLDAFISSTPAP